MTGQFGVPLAPSLSPGNDVVAPRTGVYEIHWTVNASFSDAIPAPFQVYVSGTSQVASQYGTVTAAGQISGMAMFNVLASQTIGLRMDVAAPITLTPILNAVTAGMTVKILQGD